jgi:hypothetical protein
VARPRKLFVAHAGELAHRLVRAVRPHGLVASFASSYARRHGRAGVVDEPGHIHELESTLGREAVLVMVAEIQRLFPSVLGARKSRPLEPEQAAFAKLFWPEFMGALGRALEWPPSEAAAEREAFDRDLLMYRRWTEREVFPGALAGLATSPFYDRCALLLDPATMETARAAAAEFERQLVRTAASILGHLGQAPDGRSRPARGPARTRKRPLPKPRKEKEAAAPAKRRSRARSQNRSAKRD